MSTSKSPNALVKQRYETGKRVVSMQEQRELTQREFLDVAFGLNPRTNKPYNTRTLRKWLTGERSAAKAVEQSTRRTYAFQQKVTVGEDTYGPNLIKPSGASGLDLFTPTGRKRIKRAATERLNKRITETAERPARRRGGEDYRPVTTTKGLKVKGARAVAHTRRPGVIITRRKFSPLRYTQAA